MQSTASPSLYLQQHDLSSLRLAVKQNDAAAEQAVAEQFEGLFIQMMLKSMRQAAIVDPSQHNQYQDFYQQMYDQQLAQNLSSAGGIGLANSLLGQVLQNTNPEAAERQGDAESGKAFPLLSRLTPQLQTLLAAQSSQPEEQSVEPQRVAVASLTATASPLRVTALKAQESVEALPVLDLEAVENHTSTRAFAVGEMASINLDWNHHSDWSEPKQFIAELLPAAQLVAPKLGVAPEVLVAQSALETGWGRHSMRHADGSQAFALFGIKADQRWDGPAVEKTTTEFRHGRSQKEMASFRSYASVVESMNDYADFVLESPRYQQAVENAADSSRYLQELHQAGYATDPDYAAKIERILNSDLLQQGLAEARTEVRYG